MLEVCSTLADCERVLGEKFQEVRFLGEVELLPKDVEKLGRFISDELGPAPEHGLGSLGRIAPASIAAFLVWQGILGYEEGDYWASVSRSIGLVGPRWQREFGGIFLNFLRSMDLPEFSIEGSSRFVTPILLHGGIPQKCMDQFFDSVVIDVVMSDATTEDEIRDHLYSLREAEKARAVLERELQDLARAKARLQGELAGLVALLKLKQKALELEQIAGNAEEWRHLPEDYQSYRSAQMGEAERIQDAIDGLREEGELCLEEIREFSCEHETLLELGSSIEKCREDLAAVLRDKAELALVETEGAAYMARLEEAAGDIWEGAWADCYGEALLGLPWDSLVEIARRIDALQGRRTELLEEARLHASSPVQLGPVFWVGATLVPAGLGVSLIVGYHLAGSLLASAGCIGMGAGCYRLWRGHHAERLRKACHEAISKALCGTEAELAKHEREIRRMLGGLPLELGAFAERTKWSEGAVDTVLKLKSAADAFKLYRECLLRRKELEDAIADRERQMDRLLQIAGLTGLAGADDGLTDIDDPERALAWLMTALADARARGENCIRARKRLEEEIEPRLRELGAKAAKIKRHVDELDALVIELGQGCFETGTKELKARYQAFRELGKVHADIERLALPPDVSMAREQAVDEVSRQHHARAQRIEEIKARIRDQERELASRPRAYAYVDEPIQRFIIYGGEWAEKWVGGAVRLLESAAMGGGICEDAEPDLPRRAVRAFIEWWNARQTREEGEGHSYEYSGERLPAPEFRLDPVHADLKIVLNRQRFRLDDADGASSFSVLIKAPSRPGWSKRMLLRPRRSRVPGLGEAGPVECILPVLDRTFLDDHSEATASPVARCLPGLVGTYEVSMLLGGVVHRAWEVKVLDEGTPCLVFREDGRLVPSGDLPCARLWFLLPSGWGFLKRIPLIEDATPPHLEHVCRLVLMDLRSADKAHVGDSSGAQFEFRVAREEVSEPALIGGEVVTGVSVDGDPLYVAVPPSLVVPLIEGTGADAWDVLVRYGAGPFAERRRFRLDALCAIAGVPTEGRSVQIPLDIPELLAPSTVGRYGVHLHHRGRGRVRFSLGFAVVPELWYQFEPAIIFPAQGEDNPVRLVVSVPDGARFDVDPPAELLSYESGEHEISVDPAEDIVTGELDFPLTDGERYRLPVIIDIPKVRWRLQEGGEGRHLDWSGQVEEVFLENLGGRDLLLLELEFPADVGKFAVVALDGDRQCVQKTIRNGRVEVDLLQFSDTLRAGAAAGAIIVRIFDAARRLIQEGPVLHVRWRWEVIGLGFSSVRSSGRRRLSFEWQEKGEAHHRVLRMWRLWAPWTRPLEFHIPEGQTQLVVEVDEGDLPPGSYLVELDADDPWSPGVTEARFPDEAVNTAVVQVEDGHPCVQDWEIEWLNDWEAEIVGTAGNARPGMNVRTLLLGVRKGQVLSWTATCETDADGRFAVVIGSAPEQATGVAARRSAPAERIRDSAHWIGIIIESDPEAHLFTVLPDPAPLEWKLAPTLEGTLQAPEDRSAALVEIHCEEGYLEQPILSKEDSMRVIEAWFGEANEVDVHLMFRGRREKASIRWSETRVQLLVVLTTGAHCTTCGKIEPHQEAWNQYHYPRCKSFFPLKTEVPASLFMIEDSRQIVSTCRERYPLAGHHLLTLHSSLSDGPLPPELWDGIDDVPRLGGLIEFLWTLEKRLTPILSGSERKNGHQPD